MGRGDWRPFCCFVLPVIDHCFFSCGDSSSRGGVSEGFCFLVVYVPLCSFVVLVCFFIDSDSGGVYF
jgi:hypothetical protein